MSGSIIIIGAGIAGLSAGCYAQMNGYRSRILEMHSIPGGLCTAWKRKGYTFDISAHILTGSRRGSFHRMWRELGAVQGREMVDHAELVRIESGGKCLSFCPDLGRLQAQMLELSPEDAPHIRELVDLIRRSAAVDVPMEKAQELMNPIDYVRMGLAAAPIIALSRRYKGVSLQTWVRCLRDPFLREAIRFTIDSPSWPMPDYPMAYYGLAVASMLSGNCSTPIGGAQALAFAVADRYKRLGGEIQYRARVSEILVEGDRAVGVRLEEGTEQRADVVISAADGHATLHSFMGGRYLSDTIRRYYQEWRPVGALVQVMLGVDRDLSGEPHYVAYALDRPIRVADEDRDWLGVRHSCFDPTMAPERKSVVKVWYPTRYDYWEVLGQDRARYEAEKEAIVDLTISQLDRRWPGLSKDVEVVDVATPTTYARYTGNWQGSPDGWYLTTGNAQQRMGRTLPGLDGFYMVGQWTVPYAGMPMSALSGREAIQVLCKKDRRRFLAQAA